MGANNACSGRSRVARINLHNVKASLKQGMDMLVVNDHPTVLQQFMYKLYQDQSLCDLEIVSVDGSTLWVHKLVLMASSKYIYNVCMKAPTLSKLQFGVGADILHILVEFSYTGQLYFSLDNCRTVQDAAILLQMSAAVDVLSQQMMPGTSSLLPSVDKLVPCDVYTGLREQLLPTYTDVPSVGYTQTDPCSTIDDSDSYKEVIVKLEKVAEIDENLSKVGGRNMEAGKNVLKRHVDKSSLSKQSTLLDFPGHSKVKLDTFNDLDLGKSSRLNNARKKTHVKGVTSKRSCRNAKYSGNGTQTSVNKKSEKTLQRKKGSKSSLQNLSNLGNKGKFSLKIKCLKTVKITNNDTVNSTANTTKIFSPKLLNRPCLLCKKSFSSVAELLYHRSHFHPLMNCSYLRRLYAVKQCKKKMLLWKYLKEQSKGKQLHRCKVCGMKFKKYRQLAYHNLKNHRSTSKVAESWLRFCSLKLALQKLIVPLAKDRKNRHNLNMKKSCHLGANKKLKNVKKEEKGRKIAEDGLFVCTKCERSCPSQPALYTHLQKTHQYSSKVANVLQNFCPEDMTCEVDECEYKTKGLHDMRDHVTGVHPEVKYQCSQCSWTFKVMLQLKRHVFTCHTRGKMNFHCQQCDKSFRKGSLLRKHEYFKHGIHHDNIKIYRCEYPGCKYETYASTAIKLHQSKHCKEKLFTCEYCGMKLKTEKIHRKHVDKMHLGIRPFLCQVCGLSFGEKHELQSHITNRHSNERNYQCSHCTYSTAVKATFYTHLFNVHKERADDDKRELYTCPHCPFTSILRYRYQTHVNGHTNTRNYECKVCAKSFVSANTLRSHNQWVHSDKVYSCTQCEYQTKTTQKLNEHIRVQHQLQGFKPYKCPYCTFRCATGGNTRKHVKQVHKGEEVTYIRDDELLRVARDARATGHHASLFNTLSEVSFSQEVSEDERSELSENVLHIAV